MTVRGLREKYLAFFVSKGHLPFPSGSLVPYDVTGRLDESLLFNGAGMVQFKPYFRGVAQPENRRLTTAQKCVRTGDIDEVGDDTHLTFFEMMGNFSFGDYFRTEAIDFSWEFLTSPEWLHLDPRRLAFSIYEDDEEAYGRWSQHLQSAGIDPATRIFRLDEQSNYWPAGSLTAGPPGPCGPNSEMFYWVAGEPPKGPYGRDQFVADESAGKWVEIWNDVFIGSEWQGRLRNPAKPSEGYIKEGMPDLPFKSIDTGMGLERTAMVLGGYSSVYESDVFAPVLNKIRELAGMPVTPAQITAERVVADHIRTASFCICDGVFPGNNGRGYVLRRLIRRAVLKGQRGLGLTRSFFAEIFEGVLESMGDFYVELHERKSTIVETLANEEAQFRRTLNSGAALLEEELRSLESKVLPGHVAFRLYDTFGFPLEVTAEIAAEGGFTVDVDGYETAMEEAQERSRSSQKRESVYGGVTSFDEMTVAEPPAATKFVGYESFSSEGRVVRVRPASAEHPNRWLVSLDVSPFYAESGGQAGDRGVLRSDSGAVPVLESRKSQGIFWHEVEWDGPSEELLGKVVSAEVNVEHRMQTQRNHTATHLLHAALRSVLGVHVAQAGSFVGPEGLRFDFSHNQAMSPVELDAVEQIVNREALANTPVITYVDLPIGEARAKGAMALFGEKYGDRVRMVEIGEFSKELCGGTHVRSTGEIGLFKILSESSASNGVRRIEAITGEAAYGWVVQELTRVKTAAETLRTTPNQLLESIERLQMQLKEEKKMREKAEVASLRASTNGPLDELKSINGLELWMRNFGEANPKIVANELDNAIAGHPSRIGLAASVTDGKVTLYAKAGPEAVAKGAHSGNLVRQIAKQLGGSGGGRAEFASAGGKDVSSIDAALATVPDFLMSTLA
jgi:alanyl-tRNA synthetase